MLGINLREMQITNDQLKKIYPLSKEENRQKYLGWLNHYAEIYGINTFERWCAFLAQIGHESVQLKYVEEIASGEAYEGRLNLGNVHKGDGKKYKGRGLIHVTGRGNYTAFEKWIIDVPIGCDFLESPELLKEPQYAVLSAFWFWSVNLLNRFCTLKEDDFITLTKRINGGLNGYTDRYNIWKRAMEVLK